MNETQTIEAECPSLLDRVSMHCCVIFIVITHTTTCYIGWSDFIHIHSMRIDCATVDLIHKRVRDSLFIHQIH